MQLDSVTPKGTRYVPFSQQPYCCVPTCLQMVLYKNELRLWPQEVIGVQLGLVVPPEDGKYFWNVETSGVTPISGYGTRIQEAKFGLDKFIEANKLPFELRFSLASQITGVNDLKQLLVRVQAADMDALVCFRSGAIYDNDHVNGHVCVFDVVDGDKVRLVDPVANFPKWMLVDVSKLYDAIQLHGDERMGGIWVLEKQ